MARKKYVPASFESLNGGGPFKDLTGHDRKDVSANIFMSMLQSRAYRELTDRQRCLYVACKSQYFGSRKPSRDYPDVPDLQGDDLFYLNWSLVQRFGLYRPSMSKNFYVDMEALIQAGFIDRVASGRPTRSKTIYRYSSRWKGGIN